MRRKVLIGWLVGIMALSIAACGKNTDEAENKVESSTEVIASIGTAPEDSTSSIDKSDAINFPGSETEVSTSESNEVISNTKTEVSTSESNTQTSNTKNETSESKTETSTSETSTSDSSTSKTETSTSETSTSIEPTTSESSTTPSTPVDNSSTTPSTPSREVVTQGSTGTTSFGTTYPIVSEFNKLGLNSNSSGWFSSDGMASSFSEAMGQANRALGDALGYRSNDTPIDATNSYLACLDAHITRQPDKSQYVFTYADNITTDSDGGTSARAVHQVMLGAITSTPAEVEQALFESTFTAPNGQEPINLTQGVWTTIGDCQIKFNAANITDSEFRVEYSIRPLN